MKTFEEYVIDSYDKLRNFTKTVDDVVAHFHLSYSKKLDRRVCKIIEAHFS